MKVTDFGLAGALRSLRVKTVHQNHQLITEGKNTKNVTTPLQKTESSEGGGTARRSAERADKSSVWTYNDEN